MTSYTEMLEQPQIITKIESAIGGQIVSVYLAAHLTPPIPFQEENGRFKYVDPAPQKYANHLREGMKLFAELLDEIEGKSNED